MGRKLKIFFHDNCFDGATSAALFAEFYRARIDRAAQVELEGVQHKRGDPFAGLAIDGDDNVCVDFRYCADERMNWWFDHHVSAFQPPELRAQFEADQSGQKFFDPTARSCAKFEARVLRDRFDFSPGEGGAGDEAIWGELLHWADLIDGAQFDSPEMAVELREPALRIMTWLEHNPDPRATHELIGRFGKAPLEEIAAEPWIAGPLAPLLDEHRRNIEVIRERAVFDRGVVYFDLREDGIDAHNKFIAYMLFPEARYTVGVTRSPARMKISVGSNPWTPHRRAHNIAAICERYGGGGHPVVGAVSLPPDQLARAREIAEQICAELSID